jgi:tetratricopeptide (TPR) repeat protein
MSLFVSQLAPPSPRAHHIGGRTLPSSEPRLAAAQTPLVLDWSRLNTVLAALAPAAPDFRALERGLSETDPRHTQTLLALEPAQLLQLAAHGSLATRLANAAYPLLQAGRWDEAMKLYDAALEGPIDYRACANPLYAVQRDNNHLRVDEPRARRYLQRCLPHAPKNPDIYLNAACVVLELGDLEGAMQLLSSAKAAGVRVHTYLGEAFFDVLRARPDFAALTSERKV